MSESHQVSRRNFFGQVAAGLGALGLGAVRPAKAQSEKTEFAKKIITRKLGTTGIELPVVSMGVMNANVSDLVMESYRLGVRHFDTAWIYQGGNNERMVGKVIKQLGVRKEVIIATKFALGDVAGSKTPDEMLGVIRQRLDESLSRLQTDYVDIFYFHGASEPRHIQWPQLETLLAELKKEGKIKFSGVSCHSNMTAVVNQMIQSGTWDVALVAFNFAMADDAELIQTLKAAADKGIGLVAMKTQAGGDWYRNGLQNSSKLKGALNQTAMLKWVLNHEFITTAVPGYTTFDQLRENFSVATDLSFSPDEKKFLNDRDIQMGLDFCRQCGSCTSRCPKNVDIPTLMRTHMYAFQYRNLDQAQAAIREIRPQSGLAQCMDCTTCSASCIRSVAIPHKIHDLKELAGYRCS
jgi:predicted aldo/keto reductase-like oxidoreductase